MCGIFACIKSGACLNISTHFSKIKHRGPDSSTIKEIDEKVTFAFHRLAIIDPNSKSNQPLYLDNFALICNGEIFNYKQLEKENDFKMKTMSDCEIILHLYKKYGIRKTVNILDAEFAFILYDMKNNTIFAARDPYGVRPLFIGETVDGNIFFSSEAKALTDIDNITIEQVLPGHYIEFAISKMNNLNYTKYFDIEQKSIEDNKETAMPKINKLFTQAVEKRLMSDRPIGCLLSGGLDSSLVTSIVSRNLPNLHCFSIGLEGGVDIIAAKKVAKFLNIPKSKHHIVNFTVEEGMNALKDVIYHLESYDITTIRASTPQYLLAKYIGTNTDVKVLYSGEGADELFAGYQYSKDAPSAEELHKDSIKLLKELYLYDNLRTDRTTSCWGLEVRIPFLDKEFTKYVLSLDPELIKPSKNIMEKLLLRDSFKNGYLPEEILYRPKEAFSDAVSSKEVSWYRTLASHIDKVITKEELQDAHLKYQFNTPQTKEALFYRNIFCDLFPGRDELIPRYWMPQWQGKIVDPSATVLKCHQGELELDDDIVDKLETHTVEHKKNIALGEVMFGNG